MKELDQGPGFKRFHSNRVRWDTWTVLAAVAWVIGSVLFAGSLIGKGDREFWREMLESPDLVRVQPEWLHRYAAQNDNQRGRDLLVYTYGDRRWYRFEDRRSGNAGSTPSALKIDSAQPWRAMPADQTVPEWPRLKRFAGGLLLLAGLGFFVIGMTARRRRGRPMETPSGTPIPARLKSCRLAKNETDRFVIEVESLDGQITACSEPLWIDPEPFLPEMLSIIQLDDKRGRYQVDLSFLPPVRFA